jgi:antitoxin HigA-1
VYRTLGLTITQAAAALGVTRTTLSELVTGKRGIPPEMAFRLSKVFGGSPESWLTQQAHYDLAHLRTTTSNSNAFNSPDRPRKRTRPNPQFRASRASLHQPNFLIVPVWCEALIAAGGPCREDGLSFAAPVIRDSLLNKLSAGKGRQTHMSLSRTN